MWSNIAAGNGQEEDQVFGDKLAKQMTPEDISEAQAVATKCMENNYKECG